MLPETDYSNIRKNLKRFEVQCLKKGLRSRPFGKSDGGVSSLERWIRGKDVNGVNGVKPVNLMGQLSEAEKLYIGIGMATRHSEATALFRASVDRQSKWILVGPDWYEFIGHTYIDGGGVEKDDRYLGHPRS